jgi:endonuclease III related protein
MTLYKEASMKDKTSNKILEIYNTLFAHYGDLKWWPADSPYEIMVGAILTQNTAWINVEKALANFEGKLAPELIETISIEELIKIIRPAGFFNQKAIYLKELTKWYKKYNYCVKKVQEQELLGLRKELLNTKGVGAETSDSILLYAFEFPTFVVDAYTKRLLSRMGISDMIKYDDIKALFEGNLPTDSMLFNHFHALIVINSKDYCRAKPKCTGCPLIGIHCSYTV